MAANLDIGDTRLIIEKCKKHALLRNQAAYVLGTTFWETARTMEPVRETLADSAEDVAGRLERAWKRGQLPWVKTPYWRTGFWGRGYVQLTHEYNYAKAGQNIGVDLVADPSKALDPDIAGEILVRGMRDGWFTGKKLSDYITISASNYRGARRIVNGTDKATIIAELARDYEAALTAEGYGTEPVAPVVNERRDGTQPRESLTESKTIWAQIMQWLSALGPTSFAWMQAEDPMVKAAILLGGALVIATGVVVFRERLKKWVGGIR